MLADIDGSGASNGAFAGYSNGAGATPSQRDPASSSANGTSKAVNGSSHAEHQAAPLPPSYHGHDREEVTRILIQALYEMGYQSQAESVSQASGYELESPTVAAFRAAVLGGAWADAENLLFGAAASDEQHGQRNGLVLAPGANKNFMRFWLREQKYLELLENRETSQALTVLRQELTPLLPETHRLHILSSLLMCQSTDDLKAKAEWDGAQGRSRRILLRELSSKSVCLVVFGAPFTDRLTECISPSVMLPESRLAVLLQQLKQSQIDSCLFHTSATSPSLYSDHICDKSLFPNEVALELSDLAGEVWQIQFSHDGQKLAACGSREQVIIWDTRTFTPIQVLSDHDKGVTNISWSPDDLKIVTCSMDNHALIWDANVSHCYSTKREKTC